MPTIIAHALGAKKLLLELTTTFRALLPWILEAFAKYTTVEIMEKFWNRSKERKYSMLDGSQAQTDRDAEKHSVERDDDDVLLVSSSQYKELKRRLIRSSNSKKRDFIILISEQNEGYV